MSLFGGTMSTSGSQASAVVPVAKNGASLILGLGRSLLLFSQTRGLLPASHPLLMSIGRTIASLGFLPKPYKVAQ